MRTLILSQRDVARLLPMRECVDVMADALAALAREEALVPLRSMLRLPLAQPAVFAMMPSYLGAAGTPPVFGVKAISVFPGNEGTPFDSHQGAVLLFEAGHGSLVAVLDATAITSIRTAAVSAVATRLLAVDDASELAILGAGVQAAMHLEAMTLVRPIRALRVWSRSSERARALAEVAAARHGLQATVCATAERAVREASVVCTTTSATEPVLEGAWLSEGTHVNAVGASARWARELDTAAVARARLFVDRRESALSEPGDILVPLAEGAITREHIVAEIGELLAGGGEGRGRRDAREITLFKSLGLAVEDVAAARHVYERAVGDGVGLDVALGGAREETPAAVPREEA